MRVPKVDEMIENGFLSMRGMLLVTMVSLLAWASPGMAANACSPSVGKVVLNEYNYIDNFTEVKKQDSNVNMTGWKVTVYTHNRTTSGTLPASGSNSCNGGMYQVSQFASNAISQNADIVLFDSNNDVVDVLRVRTSLPVTTAYYPSVIPACSFISPPNDLLVSSSNKGVDRSPDGVGPWRNTPGTGAGSFATRCAGNTPDAAPGTFNAFETATAAGAITGFIKTKIAGSAFGLDVVAISGSTQASTFNNSVKVELLGNTATGIGLDGNNCPISATVLQTASPTPALSGGRSTVGFSAVSDAWKDVRVRISYPAVSPTVVSCSTNNFAIRPASLASVSASDNDWQTAGTSRPLANMNASGGNVHKAGRPFTLRATALNASGNTTGNYAGSPTLKALACTLPVPTCINGILTPGTWSGSGTVTSNSASYSESGSFNLTLEDQTFANVDSADSTLFERTIPQSAAVPVGRFVPDHFDLTTGSSPLFKTFNDTACATRSFTYVGQPFGYLTLPQATITAKNAAGGTTLNTTGALWKLVSSGVTQTYAAATGTLDTGLVGTPVVAGAGSGTGTLTANAADVLAFLRSTPVAPFNALISLSMSIQDSAENAVAGNGIIGTTLPALFSNMAFDSGNEIRFGRLALTNAHGSELLSLPVPIETQFWNGSGFVLNTADHCTRFSASQVALTNWRRNLIACETSASLSGRFNAGRGNLRFGAPGVDNTGSVDLTFQLGAVGAGSACVGGVPNAATGASQTWLQGAWTGGAFDQNPAARASFGLYRGGKPLIYLREMY